MKSEVDDLGSRPSAADDVFRGMLRGALGDEGPAPDVLKGFQDKVRGAERWQVLRGRLEHRAPRADQRVPDHEPLDARGARLDLLALAPALRLTPSACATCPLR